MTATTPGAQAHADRLRSLWQIASGERERPKVGGTPHEVVSQIGSSQLYRYLPTTDEAHHTPILVVPSLVNRHYVLDLTPGRSVVEYLVGRGFDTYLIDWGRPDAGDVHTTLADYILGRMHRFVRRTARPDDRPITILGYCMGGTMSLMYAALRAEYVKNLLLLATPVDICDDGLLATWSRSGAFDFDGLSEAFGLVDGDFLQNGFTMLKPTWPFRQTWDLYRNAGNERFVDKFLAMDSWVKDTVPVAGAAYAQWCKDIYRDNALKEGTVELNGQPVKLGDVRASVLNLMADHDHLIPNECSLPASDYLTGTEVETMRFPVGHVGLSAGSSAFRDIWPKICDWLEARS